MGLSLEVRTLIAYMAASGVRHVVTSTTNHSTLTLSGYTSYHVKQGTYGQGLAVDFAERWGGGRDTPGLTAIYKALEPLGPRCAELIYAGPGGGFWKNGRRVPAYASASHHDHVHIAVPLGTDVTPKPPPLEVRPMFDPPLPIVAYLDCPTGGSWLLGKDGAIFAVGGAPYLGGANGKPYFVGRTAARLNLVDGKYQIVATSGELYGPGF